MEPDAMEPNAMELDGFLIKYTWAYDIVAERNR